MGVGAGALSTPGGFSENLNMNMAGKENQVQCGASSSNWDNVSGYNINANASQSHSQCQPRGAASASLAINTTRPAVRHTRFAVHSSINSAFKDYNKLGNVNHKDNVRLNNGYASRTQLKLMK